MGATLVCVRVSVGAENLAGGWGRTSGRSGGGQGHSPSEGREPSLALPTSPQIQGLHLTLVGQVQGGVVEDEPGGEQG